MITMNPRNGYMTKIMKMGDVKGALEGREGAEEHESQSAKSVSCNESDNGGNEGG